MKIVKRLLIILGIIVLAFVAGLAVLLIVSSKQPAVEANYFEHIAAGGSLEAKYSAMGTHNVKFVEFEVDNAYKKYEIWYPADMETDSMEYPLVIMANGTGVTASRYSAIFEHLASWGFIVVGNEDNSSWSGASSSKCLEFMLDLNESNGSVFYRKIDLENIGIAGHSQGGVGAINAATEQPNGNYYKAIFTASTTHRPLAEFLQWHYDVSKIDVPYFMVAGTLQADAGDGVKEGSNAGIAPLWSMQENFDAISDDVTKVLSRRVDKDHGDMLSHGDGYMTAWFMYYLKNDTEAGRIFFGPDAEILSNGNWQDTMKNR